MDGYTYKFSINDFRAIGNADINLNGITVLAGINGCGKSTFARSVYSVINAINRFESIQKDVFIVLLCDEIRRVSRLFSNGYKWDFSERLHNLDKRNPYFTDQAFAIFSAYQDKVSGLLAVDYKTERSIESGFKYLVNESQNGRSVDELIALFREQSNDYFNRQRISLNQILSNKALPDLQKAIDRTYPDLDVILNKITFFEDKTPLLHDGKFLTPLMLDDVIYVDTPMILSSGNVNEDSVSGRFCKLMFKKNTNILQDDKKHFRMRLIIRAAISGDIVEVDYFGQKKIHYKSNSGLDIDIENAATGIKSFAYILRLLDNGWLNSQSLLIIDEPEAHLHPQWVVEFAKVLVLLQKDLGVKILVASHNPDMVAAIHDMSDYYKLSDKTNFYIAKENEVGRYDYHYLGSEIGDIFETFNVALEMIRAYGRED